MIRALIALALLLCAACTPAPMAVVRKPAPTPVTVAPQCWQPCAQSPPWVTAPDGSADWDDLGGDQPTIESQKAQCEAARQACANVLLILRQFEVISFGGAPE